MVVLVSLPGGDGAGRDGIRASGGEQWKLPSKNRGVPEDVAVAAAVVVAAAAVGVAASCCDEPKRREHRPLATRIPAAANPAAPGGSEEAAQRCRSASKPSPKGIRHRLRSSLHYENIDNHRENRKQLIGLLPLCWMTSSPGPSGMTAADAAAATTCCPCCWICCWACGCCEWCPCCCCCCCCWCWNGDAGDIMLQGCPGGVSGGVAGAWFCVNRSNVNQIADRRSLWTDPFTRVTYLKLVFESDGRLLGSGYRCRRMRVRNGVHLLRSRRRLLRRRSGRLQVLVMLGVSLCPSLLQHFALHNFLQMFQIKVADVLVLGRRLHFDGGTNTFGCTNSRRHSSLTTKLN